MKCGDVVIIETTNLRQNISAVKSVGKIVSIQPHVAFSPVKVALFQKQTRGKCELNNDTIWVFGDCIKKMELQDAGECSNKRKTIPKDLFPEELKTFEYVPSADGVDENLLVLLHGLGDSPAPFARLAETMQIPQTACLCLRAPIPLPFDLGHGWFDGFDTQFEPLGFGYGATATLQSRRQQMGNLRRTRQLLLKMVSVLCETGGWVPERILWMGFSQGGCVALDLALQDIGFGGAISIAGPLLKLSITNDEYSQRGQKEGTEDIQQVFPRQTRTPVLLISGKHDQVVPPSQMEATHQYLLQLRPGWDRIELHNFQKAHKMISSQEEMKAVMMFLGDHTVRRALKLEAASDVIEIKY